MAPVFTSIFFSSVALEEFPHALLWADPSLKALALPTNDPDGRAHETRSKTRPKTKLVLNANLPHTFLFQFPSSQQ